jgi:hypothetical protein
MSLGSEVALTQVNFPRIDLALRNTPSLKIFGGHMKSLVCILLGVFYVSATTLGQTQFVRYAGNPVLGPGVPGAWDAGVIAGPCVVYRAPIYHMWYATTTQVGYATSPDGVQWTRYAGNPVLGPGSIGSFDDNGTRFCRVFDDGKAFHMLYTGISSGRRQIGYAFSSDGKSWTKHPQLVLRVGDGGLWDAAGVGPGSFTKDDSGWTMWYAGLSATGASGRWTSGVARSKDSLNWVRHEWNPVLPGGPAGAWDQYEQAVDCVIRVGNQYHLWFDNGNRTPYSIGYASGPDGSTWGSPPNNPIVSADVRGQVLYPWVIRWPDGHWEMWYCRYAGGIQYFDYAIDSPSGFILPNPLKINFGATPARKVGDTLVVSIWNYGRQSAQITDLSFGSSNFEMKNHPNLPFTLDSLKAFDLRIAFTPTTTGIISDSLIILTNAPNSSRRVVLLNGEGTTSVSGHTNAGLPSVFLLEQNYPNPFNPSTTIHYELPRASHVTLTVYNTLGQIVRELVDGEIDAGQHDVQFNGSGLSSGVYFYRIQAGDYVAIKRLLILR